MKKTNRYFPITLLDNLPPTLLVILFLLLLTSVPLLGQGWNTWSDPISITDSLSDNKNATIRYLSFIDNNFYVFWEKSTDTLSTAIYYKNFYNGDEARVFLSDEGVHYTDPQLVNLFYRQQNDSLFYVFYESDEAGFNNIYYRVYNASGFTAPQALTTSTVEKTDLLCNNSGRIVWMEQNRIMHSKLDKYTHVFEEPFVIDSGNCYFPSIVQTDIEWSGDLPVVAWIKEENDSSNIKIRQYDQNDGWLEPETIFTGAQCSNLSFCTGMDQSGILTWDYFNDTSWHFLYYDLEDNQVYVSENSQQKLFQPSYYSGTFFVKSKDVGPGYTTFVYQNNDTTGIYTSDFYGFNPPFNNYQNVSKSDNPVKHPQLFTGKFESPCYYYSINIWEEEVDEHWQLKYSSAFVCLSDIEENKPTDVNLSVNPNPFREEINISFSLTRSSEVMLSILNISGVNIETLVNKRLNIGQHDYIWNGNQYKPGIYYVVLRSNYGITTKKIILSK